MEAIVNNGFQINVSLALGIVILLSLNILYSFFLIVTFLSFHLLLCRLHLYKEFETVIPGNHNINIGYTQALNFYKNFGFVQKHFAPACKQTFV